jgi:hypothetical protein
VRRRQDVGRPPVPAWALDEDRWDDAKRWAEANGWSPLELLIMRRDAQLAALDVQRQDDTR